MIYDSGIIDLMIDLKKSKGEAYPYSLMLAQKLLKNKAVVRTLTIIENTFSFLLNLQIPILKDMVKMVITHYPGSPKILGNYLRGIFYKRQLKKLGKNVLIDEGVFIKNPDETELDDFVYLDKYVFLNVSKVKIGRRVHIAENCHITGAGEFIMEDFSCMAHSSAVVTASDTPNFGYRGSGPMVPMEQRKVEIGKVHIKKDAFIGMAARLINNVTVGEGAVVGSGAMVVKDIPDWKIAVGVPAKVIGEREAVKFPDV